MQQNFRMRHRQPLGGINRVIKTAASEAIGFHRVFRGQGLREQSTRILPFTHGGVFGGKIEHLPLFAFGDEHLDAVASELDRKYVRLFPIRQQTRLQHQSPGVARVIQQAQPDGSCAAFAAVDLATRERHIAACRQIIRPDQMRVHQRPLARRTLLVIDRKLKHTPGCGFRGVNGRGCLTGDPGRPKARR
jgi:hypothetical protein